VDNTSGQGSGAAVPNEVKGLSWGGFWWTFIWGIFNRVWFSFLIFIPVVGFLVGLILLFKGRQWAWENKRWDSVEHFNTVQRRWGLAGLLIVGVVIVAVGASVAFLGSFMGEESQPVTAGKAAPPAIAKAATTKPRAEVPAAPVVPQAAAPRAAPQPTPAAAEVSPAAKFAAPPALRPPVAKAVKPEPAESPAAPQGAAPEASSQAAMTRTVTMAAPPEFSAGPVVRPGFNDLMTAVLYRNAAGVNELLALGKWPDKPDSRGATPLMAAVTLGDAVTAEALLKAGANPNLGALNGSTAGSLARERSDDAMTALLKRYGAR
jgi:hypothetical protein